MKLLLYPLSLLQPAAGLTLAVLYLRQEDQAARRFGRNCLILGLLGMILSSFRPSSWDAVRSSESLTQPFY